MKEQTSSSVIAWIDSVVLTISAAVAFGYAVMMTPPSFWVSAWLIQAIAFGVAVAKGRDGDHWPSTFFGAVEFTYILVLLVILSSRGIAFSSIAPMFFGLLFVHGILYIIAAKPFFIRRGYIKPTNT